MINTAPQFVSDVGFTDAVKAVQGRLGSRKGYARMEEGRGWENEITPELRAFIAERDSMYLATASADGRPYVQHRGGPRGFLKVLDEKTLAFGDLGGNQQYISVGNLSENDQAFIFLMDYVNRRRIKIWGRARVIEDDPVLLEKLSDPAYSEPVQRAFVFHVEAWDVNCPRHITPRFTEDEMSHVVGDLRDRIAALEAENRRLRERIEAPAKARRATLAVTRDQINENP